MPRHKKVRSLVSLSSSAVASVLLKACQTLDRRWEEPATPPQLWSPKRHELSPLGHHLASPSREEVVSVLPSEQRPLLAWLSHLPDPVVETVVARLLDQVEAHLMEDKDKQLIMTMINIENMKVNDFFFGIHSLLSLIRGFSMTSLHFSRRLWCCLADYGEITGSRRLSDTLCCSLPGLASLTCLSLAHVASDRVVYVVARHLPGLVSLDLASSRVTDRGLKFLTGNHQVVAFQRPGSVSTSAVRNLANLPDIPSATRWGELPQRWGEEEPPSNTLPSLSLPAPAPSPLGCPALESVDLHHCDGVSEAGVRHVLEHLNKLKKLVYHQVSSVLEILIKWGSCMSEEERGRRQLALTEVEHGFPYGLSPLSAHVTQLSRLCPLLTTVTLVTEDRLTVEMEDCLGEGFLSLLEQRGNQLEELSLSCRSVSDPEAYLPLEVAGGQQGQLFNLATLAVGLMVPGVRKLSVSGCGLVASVAMQRLELLDRIGNSSWINKQNWFSELRSLLLMSYEDSLPSMTINSGLLRSVLSSARHLSVLNMEGNFGSFLTDSFLSSVLAINPLENLATIDISFNDQGGVPGRVPLTYVTIRTLLRRCPDLRELRVPPQVSDWAISDVEFSSLEEEVRANNWDIFLTRKLATT